MSKKISLIVAGLALLAALVVTVFSSVIAAPAQPDGATFDSTCGTVTGSSLSAVTHSCWVDNSDQQMRHWQPKLVGSDPNKPAYQAVFEMPIAASCTWWGVNASITSASGEVEIVGRENVTFTLSSRTTVTVTDSIGGGSAGFDIWCSGVTGDIVPTATPTQTPTMTSTPTATATATHTPMHTATPTATPYPTEPAEMVLTSYTGGYQLRYYYESSEPAPAVRLLVAGSQQWIEFPLTWEYVLCGCQVTTLPSWAAGVEVAGEVALRLDADGWYLKDRRFMRGQEVFIPLVQR